jgi:FixJ family two-component response regulator
LQNRLRIAVVDDDQSVREALENLISSVGYEVDLFESAKGFLDSAEINNTACLVLDLRMPEMSGLELQQTLRDDGRNIPIIIVTAHGEDTARSEALAAGAVAFLNKPFQEEVLLGAINSAIGKKLRSGEPLVERKQATDEEVNHDE